MDFPWVITEWRLESKISISKVRPFLTHIHTTYQLSGFSPWPGTYKKLPSYMPESSVESLFCYIWPGGSVSVSRHMPEHCVAVFCQPQAPRCTSYRLTTSNPAIASGYLWPAQLLSLGKTFPHYFFCRKPQLPAQQKGRGAVGYRTCFLFPLIHGNKTQSPGSPFPS